MSDLIDTTEMYLRTIFELEEDGIAPLRARIAQRLGQSGPTVSQTVARMERDGLLKVEDDRHLVLTAQGQFLAGQVMRRHRLAECLLLNVLNIPLESLHEEACKWEHVMSDLVEEKIAELLNNPTHSPFGNAIPGLAINEPGINARDLMENAEGNQVRTVIRIGETLQDNSALIALYNANVRPQHTVTVARENDAIVFNGEVTLTSDQAAAVWFVA